MASSGSFSGSIHSGHYVLRVDWTQTKNVSANTSTITAKAYLVNDWSLSINGRSDNKVTIDGTAQTYASPTISSTGTHLLGTVTQTVNHASDGSKSLTMSAVFYIRATLSGTYYESITASANITLDSIDGFRIQCGDGFCYYDCHQPCIFFFYPRADLCLWKHHGDDCHKDHGDLSVMDTAPYAGKPDTKGSDGNLHDYLYHL